MFIVSGKLFLLNLLLLIFPLNSRKYYIGTVKLVSCFLIVDLWSNFYHISIFKSYILVKFNSSDLDQMIVMKVTPSNIFYLSRFQLSLYIIYLFIYFFIIANIVILEILNLLFLKLIKFVN